MPERRSMSVLGKSSGRGARGQVRKRANEQARTQARGAPRRRSAPSWWSSSASHAATLRGCLYVAAVRAAAASPAAASAASPPASVGTGMRAPDRSCRGGGDLHAARARAPLVVRAQAPLPGAPAGAQTGAPFDEPGAVLHAPSGVPRAAAAAGTPAASRQNDDAKRRAMLSPGGRAWTADMSPRVSWLPSALPPHLPAAPFQARDCGKRAG